MKKILKMVNLLFSMLIFISIAACKPKVSKIGSGKLYQINVSMYEGGFGTDWIQELANGYNEILKNTDYEVVIVPEKRLADSIITELNNGSGDYHLYVNAGNEIVSGIYLDFFEDLTDIVESKAAETENKTIKDKIVNYDTWQSVYSNQGNGLYALTYSSAMVGMVIDHQQFIDNGWYTFATVENDAEELSNQGITYEQEDDKLTFVSSTGKTNYKVGDYILTSGKDGKFGTYDDGQPVTLDEFSTLITNICASDVYPFIWAGSDVGVYMNYIFEALFAQYEGEEDYMTYYTYDSNGRDVKLLDNSTTKITFKDGYKVQQLEGIKVAYEFFEDYFDYNNNGSAYAHPNCKDNSASQFDTQNKYLLGYQGSNKNPESAILIEGIWWEQEASSMFNTAQLKAAHRGKGEREYRYLLLPNLPNQASTKSCFSVCETGSICVPKDNNKERLEYTKGFVKYMLQDESLRMITRTTGNILNYKYDLTDSDKEQMTPFQRNAYEIYNDSENIFIAHGKLNNLISPLSYASDKVTMHNFLPNINTVFPNNIIEASKKYDINQILTGLENSLTKSMWDSYIEQAKKNGFFKDVA